MRGGTAAGNNLTYGYSGVAVWVQTAEIGLPQPNRVITRHTQGMDGLGAMLWYIMFNVLIMPIYHPKVVGRANFIA